MTYAIEGSIDWPYSGRMRLSVAKREHITSRTVELHWQEYDVNEHFGTRFNHTEQVLFKAVEIRQVRDVPVWICESITLFTVMLD